MIPNMPQRPVFPPPQDGVEWRPVSESKRGFISSDGRYANGRTRSVTHGNADKDGYRQVNVERPDGKYVTRRVHVLVAQAFLPNPDSLPEVDHLDKDRTNNDRRNLEWVSKQENLRRRDA